MGRKFYKIDPKIEPSLREAFVCLAPLFDYNGNLEFHFDIRNSSSTDFWINVQRNNVLLCEDILIRNWSSRDIGELVGRILHHEVNPKLNECIQKVFSGIPEFNSTMSDIEAEIIRNLFLERISLPIYTQHSRLVGLVYRISGLIYAEKELKSPKKRRPLKENEEEMLITNMANRIYDRDKKNSILKLAKISPYEARIKILEDYEEDILPGEEQ